MEVAIIIILLIFWFLGYIIIPGIAVPKFPLFFFLGHPVTLWDILVFLLILWAIGILPSPLRQIAGVILVLWVLSALGVIIIVGLSHVLIIALIIGLVLSAIF